MGESERGRVQGPMKPLLGSAWLNAISNSGRRLFLCSFWLRSAHSSNQEVLVSGCVRGVLVSVMLRHTRTTHQIMILGSLHEIGRITGKYCMYCIYVL